MAIDILVVKEDLKTVVTQVGSIEANQDFYQLQRIARYMNLAFIATIDEAGDTIINQPQLYILASEIMKLRISREINHDLLNLLQAAIDAVKPYSCQYILFVGD